MRPNPLALATCIAIAAISNAAGQSTPQPDHVSARVRAARDIKVAARVSGVVVERPVARNASVKAGDPILIIDSTFQRFALQRARAGLLKAEADLRLATRELEREIKLQAGSSTFESQIDRLDAARKGAEAALISQKIAVGEAEETLARCTVRAPEAGVVSEIWPEIGEAVALLGPVARLVTAHELVAESFLSASERRRVSLGMQLRVAPAVGPPGRPPLMGKVVELATAASERTWRLRVAIPTPLPDGVVPGLDATIQLPPAR